MERQNLSLFLNENCADTPKLSLVGLHKPSHNPPLHLDKQSQCDEFFDSGERFGHCVRSGLVVIHVNTKKSSDHLLAEIDAGDHSTATIPTSRDEIEELKRAYENRGVGYLVTPTIGFGPLGDMLTRLWLESRNQSTDPPSAA